jgi:hypothetical protein
MMIDEIAPNTSRVTPSSLQAKIQAINTLHLIGQIGELRREIEALKAEVKRLHTAPVPNLANNTSPAPPDVLNYLNKCVDVLFANQKTNHVWAGELLRDHAVAIDELTARTMPWMIDFTQEIRDITGMPAFCDPSKLPQKPNKPKA